MNYLKFSLLKSFKVQSKIMKKLFGRFIVELCCNHCIFSSKVTQLVNLHWNLLFVVKEDPIGKVLDALAQVIIPGIAMSTRYWLYTDAIACLGKCEIKIKVEKYEIKFTFSLQVF